MGLNPRKWARLKVELGRFSLVNNVMGSDLEHVSINLLRRPDLRVFKEFDIIGGSRAHLGGEYPPLE